MVARLDGEKVAVMGLKSGYDSVVEWVARREIY
jgi:hypothetical protein